VALVAMSLALFGISATSASAAPALKWSPVGAHKSKLTVFKLKKTSGTPMSYECAAYVKMTVSAGEPWKALTNAGDVESVCVTTPATEFETVIESTGTWTFTSALDGTDWVGVSIPDKGLAIRNKSGGFTYCRAVSSGKISVSGKWDKVTHAITFKMPSVPFKTDPSPPNATACGGLNPTMSFENEPVFGSTDGLEVPSLSMVPL
jgi:hypothetical protein